MPRYIAALDFANLETAEKLLSYLDPRYFAIKVGSEMFSLFGASWVKKLTDLHYSVFLDLKFHDIPNTVAQACKAACGLGIWMVNVHAAGGLAMMQAARNAINKHPVKPLLIAVTVLTSMTEENLGEIGITSSLEEHVLQLASLAKKAGLDGVVCSAHEVALIKQQLGQDFLTITPGVRLAGNTADDQSRIVTPEMAFATGSDFLVVGRAITNTAAPQKVIQHLLDILPT